MQTELILTEEDSIIIGIKNPETGKTVNVLKFLRNHTTPRGLGVQTRFRVNRINNNIRRIKKLQPPRKGKLIRQAKLCLWCCNAFLPRANKQQYCSKEHAHYATLENKAKYSRKYRRKYHDIIRERNKVPVGTGMIGCHFSGSFDEEYETVHDEAVRLGLREKDDKYCGGFL